VSVVSPRMSIARSASADNGGGPRYLERTLAAIHQAIGEDAVLFGLLVSRLGGSWNSTSRGRGRRANDCRCVARERSQLCDGGPCGAGSSGGNLLRKRDGGGRGRAGAVSR